MRDGEEESELDKAIELLKQKAIEIEDQSTAFNQEGKSGVVDVTEEMAIAAMKKVVDNKEVNIQLTNLKNSKEQTVTVSLGDVSKNVDVSLTVVPNKNNGQELKFVDGVKDLKIIVFEGGKNTRYSLEDLKKHEDKNIKALGEKIIVKDNTIIIPENLLSTKQWTEIKENEGSKILRAYRVTIVNNGEKVAKIAMYENGTAVIEK